MLAFIGGYSPSRELAAHISNVNGFLPILRASMGKSKCTILGRKKALMRGERRLQLLLCRCDKKWRLQVKVFDSNVLQVQFPKLFLIEDR